MPRFQAFSCCVLSSPSATETELKLAIPPGALRRLAAHPLLQRGEPLAAKKLHTIYFDTPEFDLRRHNVALRVRRDGTRWVQTVKGGGAVRSGLHQRVEIEWDVPGPNPDCARVSDGPLAELLATPGLHAQLRPVFTTDFRRRSRMIELGPDSLLEASIDRGEIRSGEAVEPLSELELELKSGSPRQLFELALELLESIPLRVENRSKAARGYALIEGTVPAPTKAAAIELSRDMSVADAARSILWATLHHLQANERGVLESDDNPEYLHQMRVALRRLRSAFSVFSAVLPAEATAPFAPELRWLARALGPARDWDVFMTETLPPVRDRFPDHEGLARFDRTCARERRAAAGRARRAVVSRRYSRLVLRLAAALSTDADWTHADDAAREALAAPVTAFATAVLEARYAKVRKRGRRLKRRSAAELHRLRIAVKKLRYAGDFFSTLFDAKAARGMLALLARLQTVLGGMNDASTVGHLVHCGRDATTDTALAEARGIVLGWSHGQALGLKRELRAAWKTFRGAEKFW